jgi:hypothetical protein
MKKISFLLIALILSIVPAFAETIEKTYTFEQYTISQSGEYHLITFDNCILTGLSGEPVLPYHAIKLLLPPGHEAVAVEFTGELETSIPGNFMLYPRQYSQPISKGRSGKFVRNENVYSQDLPYPSTSTGALTTGFMNGFAIALSSFTPLIYNPATGAVSYYRQVTIRIETRESDVSMSSLSLLPVSNAQRERVMDFAQNSEVALTYPTVATRDETYNYLIITPAQYQNSFGELAGLYLKRGIETEIITTEFIQSNFSGQDLQEKIRNCIIQEYTESGIEYVLLAGDVEYVPYRGFYCTVQSSSVYESDNIPSDLYYSGLDGTWNDNGNSWWGEIGEDDLLPDVAVTRLPFGSQAELNRMLHKTIFYQDNIITGELRNPLLAGEWLYNNPVTYGSDYLELLIGYHEDNGYTTHGIPEDQNIEKLYEEENPWSGATLITLLNTGKSVLYHVGHASTTYTMYLSNSDITNVNFSQLNGIDHNYTIAYTHGCDCGGFDYNDCILEEMVKIDNFAAAVVGNSRYGWFNEGQTEGPSAHLNREFVDALYHDKLNRIGRAHMESRIQTSTWVNAPGQWEEGALRWCFYDCNVLGESAMAIWTDEPVSIDVTYTTTIPIGETYLEATVSSQGQPLEGMVAVVMKDSVSYGKGITDEYGLAGITLDEPFTEPCEAELIVTGYNCEPHSYPITVIPNLGAYMIFSSLEIGDQTGNGNGLPDFGESISLTVDITNVGSQAATGVQAVLSTSDPNITLTDDQELYGDISGGQSVSIENAFAFSITDNIPDQHAVVFQLTMTASGTWVSDFTIIVNAPALGLGNIVVDDTEVGNGNGILDPGETADLAIATSNSGHSLCTGVTGLISSSDPYLNIINELFQASQLAPGETQYALYRISVSQSTPPGTTVEINCQLTSGAYSVAHEYAMAVGIIVEDFESGDFTGHNWEFEGDAPWEICETNPYEGSYCAKSGSILDSESSEMMITAEVLVDDTLSFYRKVSSEESYDFLQFYIDNIKMGEWSGELEWGLVSFPVTEGDHMFKWIYSKDWYVSSGDDAAWIDMIVFPPIYTPVSIPESGPAGFMKVYPNPLTDNLFIDYTLTESSRVKISIIDASGQELFILADNLYQQAGSYRISQDIERMPAGMYYCRIVTETGILMKKLMKI